MAGAGYKLFNTGDVLTAAQVNTYLMEQTVMRFATTTARDTALSGVLAEGMICYIDADNNLYKYTGSAWVNIDSGSTSPLTTKGDLYTYSTTDARLAVGNNGETLVADSSATAGLRWQPQFLAGKNKFLNGALDIWQRGTSFSYTGSGTLIYCADRITWFANGNGTFTISQQAFTPGTAPVAGYESQYFLRAAVGTIGTSTEGQFNNWVEDVRTLANQTTTVSFWAKASSTTNVAVACIQSFGSGGSADVVTTISTVSVGTAWARYSLTFTMPSVSGKTIGAGSYFRMRFLATLSASLTVDYWGFQIEAGSVATPFSTATGTLAGELAACQRYYYLHSTGANKTIALGAAFTSGEVDAYVPFKVSMRTAPTLVASSGTNYYNFNRNSATDSFNSWTIYNAHETGCQIYNNTEISSTAGQAGIVENANASASVAFSAEL